MVPLRLDPVCCQVSVNEPEKGPLYCPDQVPPSAPVGAVVAVGAGVGGYLATHPGPDLAIDFRAR